MQLYVTFIDPGRGWTSGLLTWLPARTWPKYAAVGRVLAKRDASASLSKDSDNDAGLEDQS